MRPETAEWVAKAEADFASMQRENSVVQSPNYDLICFLAQQCVEKYLKGLLCEQTISFPKTHDLNKLAALLPASSSCPQKFAPMLARLDRYSVEFRYPGSSATQALATASAREAATIRSWARDRLAIAD
jgi:HEPN domain-containing protein